MVETSRRVRIWGRSLPDGLIKAIARDVHVPLLGEGWFVAGVVWGGSVAAITFVLFGSVFFAGMPHADPAAVGRALRASLFIGLLGGLAGLVVDRRLRRSRQPAPAGSPAELHRAVALHRWLAAGLLMLLGLAGLWHAWLFSPATAALGSLAFVMALSLGFVALPSLLALLTGQPQRLGRAARAGSPPAAGDWSDRAIDRRPTGGAGRAGRLLSAADPGAGPVGVALGSAAAGCRPNSQPHGEP